MSREPSYDTRFFDLAEYFLSDTPELNTAANAHDLAAHIQLAIESWFEDRAASSFEPSNVSGAVK
jgi:hypothetical protein